MTCESYFTNKTTDVVGSLVIPARNASAPRTADAPGPGSILFYVTPMLSLLLAIQYLNFKHWTTAENRDAKNQESRCRKFVIAWPEKLLEISSYEFLKRSVTPSWAAHVLMGVTLHLWAHQEPVNTQDCSRQDGRCFCG